VAGPLLTFHLVVFAQIVFRAQSVPSAFNYIKGLVPGFRPENIPAWRLDLSLLNFTRGNLAICACGLVVAEAINFAMWQPYWIDRFTSVPRIIRWGLYYAAIVILLCSFRESINFIYAQF
jgi:hypothetical protein